MGTTPPSERSCATAASATPSPSAATPGPPSALARTASTGSPPPPARCWQRYSAGQRTPRLRLGLGRTRRGKPGPIAARPPLPGHWRTRLLPGLGARPAAADHPDPGRRQPLGDRGDLPSRVGLDHHQVRGWTPRHRFITLAMLALAFLAVPATSTNNDQGHPGSDHLDGPNPPPYLPDPRRPIPLTLAELRHLLAHLVTRPMLDVAHLPRRSTWRRRHQARARYCHYRRQLNI